MSTRKDFIKKAISGSLGLAAASQVSPALWSASRRRNSIKAISPSHTPQDRVSLPEMAGTEGSQSGDVSRTLIQQSAIANTINYIF